MTDAAPRSRGHLTPGADGVSVDRFELGLSHLVRHVWIVTWSLPDTVVVPQRVLGYPAVNIVFEPENVALYGPDSRVDTRVLQGEAWAVGILFRPAAGVLLSHTTPSDLVRLAPDGEPVDGAPHDAVRTHRADGDRARLVDTLRSWLAPVAGRIDESGLLLNRACAVAENDVDVVRVDELAASVGVSVRALERLVRSRLGVTPKWLIECRRMQNAATRLYAEDTISLAALAAELGFVDYAHLSRRYSSILHETPDQTRRAGERARAVGSG